MHNEPKGFRGVLRLLLPVPAYASPGKVNLGPFEAFSLAPI